MQVRDVLEAAFEAAVEIRRIEEQIEARRSAIGVQGHSYGVHAKTGILDPSRKVDDLMDWEMELVNVDELQKPIEEAYRIVAGVATFADDSTVEVVTRRFLQGESWVEIARDIERRTESFKRLKRGEQVRCLKEAMDHSILDWEKIGIARLKEMGRG